MKSFTVVVALALGAAPAALAASSGGRTRSGDSDQGRSSQDSERQMLIRTVQQQQQTIDLLIRAVLSNGKVDPKMLARLQSGTPAPPAAEEEPAPAPARDIESSSEQPRSTPSRPPAAAPASKGGSVMGTLNVLGGSREGAVVYVENVKAPTVRDANLVIKQINKQFSPQVAVVQRGTRVEFPNLDTVFHNAFSLSPGNSFDLGTYRAGDPSKSVTLLSPGVVQVFCNMHPQMVANILVVPNGYFAKVQPDGTFKIDGVPAGKRKLVAWLPNSEPISQDVEVVAGYSSEASLTLTAGKKSTHTNKLGQAYGSYKE